MTRRLFAAVALVLLLAPAALVDARRKRQNGDRVPGQYVVVFESEQGEAEYKKLVHRGGASASIASAVLPLSVGKRSGEVVKLSRKMARRLRRLRGVKLHQDRYVVLDDSFDPTEPIKTDDDDGLANNITLFGGVTPGSGSLLNQATLSWGIDRVDQRKLPLDNRYTYNSAEGGTGVTVYVVDTGIRVSHNDFGGRASWGYNAAGDGLDDDFNGHGTHVAGLIGGTSWGVAKQVSLVAVKVLDKSGSGTYSSIVDGIAWAVSDCAASYPASAKRCVINMSLGGPSTQLIDDAVQAAVSAGVTVVVAGGNDKTDACASSPARAPGAIAVGATDRTDSRDQLYSNYGSCIDIFAPGTAIYSAWSWDLGTGAQSDTAFLKLSGTSMAAPHVSGVAAVVYSKAAPGVTLSPADVRKTIQGAASGQVTNAGAGSPNRLLYKDPSL